MTRAQRIDRAGKSFVVALCVYEAVAITTGRVPTISGLCRRRRALEAAFVAAWIVHIHVQFAEKAARAAIAEEEGAVRSAGDLRL